MKKVLVFIISFLVLFVGNVNANIVCNDGTVSKTCTDCHRGCCSGHDGCTANPNHGDNIELTDSSTTTRTTTTRKEEKKSSSNDDSKYFIFVTGAAVGSIATYITNKKKH